MALFIHLVFLFNLSEFKTSIFSLNNNTKTLFVKWKVLTHSFPEYTLFKFVMHNYVTCITCVIIHHIQNVMYNIYSTPGLFNQLESVSTFISRTYAFSNYRVSLLKTMMIIIFQTDRRHQILHILSFCF